MTPSPEPRLARFSRAERWTHRAIAVLVVTLIVSAACLYFPDLSALVGNRELFKRLHIIAGFVLPVPILIALCIAAFRADLTRLNRFTPDDWRWFRKQQRRTGALKIGKFNAGQKLHSHVEAGALIVLFGTGMIMYFSGASLMICAPVRRSSTTGWHWGWPCSSPATCTRPTPMRVLARGCGPDT
ncbi:MAG: cytochrome b/b6 domain-containing protein [Candidatus Nanopelagicales bacterium]